MIKCLVVEIMVTQMLFIYIALVYITEDKKSDVKSIQGHTTGKFGSSICLDNSSILSATTS